MYSATLFDLYYRWLNNYSYSANATAQLIIGISETVRDTRSRKLWKICAVWCLISPVLKLKKSRKHPTKNEIFYNRFDFFLSLFEEIHFVTATFSALHDGVIKLEIKRFVLPQPTTTFLLPLYSLNTIVYHSFPIFKRFDLRTEISFENI